LRQKAILMGVQDDVATALTDLTEGERISVSLQDVDMEVSLLESIEFGHKFALRDIAEGEDVLKYGMSIGKALTDIKAGAWVHVHNCRSDHFGFHREQYGLKA